MHAHFFVKTALLLLLLTAFLNACERFPGHYVEFNQCLIDETSVGEDYLIAYAELEEWLLAENLLESADQASYARLLKQVARGERDIRAADAAPEVRDFWALQEGGSFGAFFRCAETMSETFDEGQAASIHGMNRVFQQMRPDRAVGNVHQYDDAGLLERLATEAITEEDFEFTLYRASLLNLLVFMMD